MTGRELSSLFERRRYPRIYPTMRAELDAVRDGRKAIALEVWPHDALDRDYSELVRLARARGLQIVHQPERSRGGLPIVAVYALHAEQAWRIPALHALWRIVPPLGWGDSAEALEGFLLGYTEPQIAAWLEARQRERLGWRGTTIYLLLTPMQRSAIAEAGHRSLSREALATGLTALACDATRVIKRRMPSWIARRRLALARVAISDQAVARLFGRGPVRTTQLTPTHASVLDVALESSIQVYDRGRWRDR